MGNGLFGTNGGALAMNSPYYYADPNTAVTEALGSGGPNQTTNNNWYNIGNVSANRRSWRYGVQARTSRGVRVRRHFTYANVTATIALYVALGGISYAVLRVPARSVGPAQLRPRAVGPTALAVALGGASVETQDVKTFTDYTRACRSGSPPPPCVPPVAAEVASVRIKTHARGTLLFSAVTGMTNANAASGDVADVTLTASVDGRKLPGQSTVQVPFGRPVSVPLQASARLSAGTHTVRLQIRAINFNGELRVSPVSLHAAALPTAQ